MNAAKDIRSDILELLIQVEDIETLKEIRKELELIYRKTQQKAQVKGEENSPGFLEGVKGIRENVTLEQLKSEQNYSPCTFEAFRADADQIDWGDLSLEEMLQAIK